MHQTFTTIHFQMPNFNYYQSDWETQVLAMISLMMFFWEIKKNPISHSIIWLPKGQKKLSGFFLLWFNFSKAAEPLGRDSLLLATTFLRVFWCSLDQSQKDARLIWPWSHSVVLNQDPGLEIQHLTTRTLLQFWAIHNRVASLKRFLLYIIGSFLMRLGWMPSL